MSPSRRRVLTVGLVACVVVLSFALGAWSSQRRIELQVAANDAHIAELRDQMARNVLQARRERRPLGTGGLMTRDSVDGESQSSLIEEIKRQLQSEMGLLPIRVL